MAEVTDRPQAMTEETKIQLLRFLTAVAWSDNTVAQAEAGYIRRLARQLELRGAAFARVAQGLTQRPSPSALRIDQIPAPERRRFLAEAEKLISADGRTAPAERKILDLLRKAILAL